MHRGKVSKFYTVFLPTILFILIFLWIGVPLLIAVLWSLVDPQTGWSYKNLLPPGLSLFHWRYIFLNTSIVQSIGTSFFIATITTVISFFLSLPTAYAVGQKNLKGKDFLKLVMLLPMLLPGMAIAVFLGRILNLMGFSENIFGVMIGHIFLAMPYMLRLLTVSFESVPADLIFAAKNLGASRFHTFMEVYIPLIAPGISAGALFAFVTSIEEFNIAFIVGTPAIQTITTVLYSYLGRNFQLSASSVVSLILIVPNLVLLLIAERFIKTEHLGAALGKL